jgi:hypothetical protein
MDFGLPGDRKLVGSVRSHMRVRTDVGGTDLEVAEDLRTDFSSLDKFELSYDDNQKIISVVNTVGKRKITYLQVKYTNSTYDEPFELTGIDFRVAGIGHKGLVEAAETQEEA